MAWSDAARAAAANANRRPSTTKRLKVRRYRHWVPNLTGVSVGTVHIFKGVSEMESRARAQKFAKLRAARVEAQLINAARNAHRSGSHGME